MHETSSRTLSKTSSSDGHESPGAFDKVLDWVLDRDRLEGASQEVFGETPALCLRDLPYA